MSRAWLGLTAVLVLVFAGRLGAQVTPPKPKPKPAAAQSQRCIFQIDNVDRQGAVNETPTEIGRASCRERV